MDEDTVSTLDTRYQRQCARCQMWRHCGEMVGGFCRACRSCLEMRWLLTLPATAYRPPAQTGDMTGAGENVPRGPQ